ncbi:MAG TPA: urea transporter [Candidatus Wunengus sp. YC63]|uniref:urea transporter n=1 Tax=Candidatus Wunengus sp. YC63 TaxID=3367699 RepID=UPI002713C6D7|nr:urea transporter [Candidatus Brocadiales bacterium]
MSIRNFAEIFFRGISQIFLLNNVITGILFLAGAFYNSWPIGIGAVIGVLAGTFTALLFKYGRDDINQGLYGYNGALVGLATVYFFGLHMPSVIALFFGAVLSSIIMNFITTWKLPPFTAPFIISTWIVMAIILTLHIIPLQAAQLPNASNLGIIPALSRGIGQVMFQENIFTGIILFIGILVCSRISALYALMGTGIGVIVACVCSFPLSMITAGLFGFNGVLCGIALSGKKWHHVILAIASIVVSVFIMFGMNRLGIITLTAPFVISTWLVLLISNALRYRLRRA